ncbi:hypothetical protein BG262_02265 [Floricoccus penangensis]|uniref:DUF5067 domain-containing protein n=1 Tax=Floricoccus penangensis TaxID=1859475 RepID=A0A9Q5JFZ4_9LACT|nr:DUF5067 domain-containing protein [Floricoccus penangensis]OFI46648.1 hypothetical protein BG262_02265 [Floricoccus penangensis]
MRKIINIGILISSVIILSSCMAKNNSTKEVGDNKNETVISDTKEKKEATLSSSTEPTSKTTDEEDESDIFVQSASDAFFDGTYLKGNSYSIKITDYKVIKAGEKGNESGEKPVLAFWYDTYVNPNYDNSAPISAYIAWSLNFNAVQDNNPNIVNELKTNGKNPDKTLSETEMSEIKAGGKVSNAVSYELTDDKTPVTLIAGSLTGSQYGKKDFPIQ